MDNTLLAEPEITTSVFLKDVSVAYRVPTERIGTIKEYLIKKVRGKVQHKHFYALQDINLNVEQGEIFGIIGRNGAGKSTLLKVISRVLSPTNGRVWIKGVVAPLLELGAGFHPELTGLENVYLNGTLLGHTRQEITEKLDSILAFSEIGDFINAPIRTYSSGMVARLGFSVATAWEPDILILDEVLSVGDAAFRAKCSERMLNLIKGKSTVLLVTHSSSLIAELCTRAILLDHGKIISSGNGAEISDQYMSMLNI
ncbi:MAG TPA: ABC transporter ATP-binding protein [Anaerolineaceae bacterium]|jgi:ABC-type polysaccharide/polyol phosphate transport system ATPase subunit|nr:ABC transporter ATP-binding protein [Anaerolineaceae bacterium]